MVKRKANAQKMTPARQLNPGRGEGSYRAPHLWQSRRDGDRYQYVTQISRQARQRLASWAFVATGVQGVDLRYTRWLRLEII